MVEGSNHPREVEGFIRDWLCQYRACSKRVKLLRGAAHCRSCCLFTQIIHFVAGSYLNLTEFQTKEVSEPGSFVEYHVWPLAQYSDVGQTACCAGSPCE